MGHLRWPSSVASFEYIVRGEVWFLNHGGSISLASGHGPGHAHWVHTHYTPITIRHPFGVCAGTLSASIPKAFNPGCELVTAHHWGRNVLAVCEERARTQTDCFSTRVRLGSILHYTRVGTRTAQGRSTVLSKLGLSINGQRSSPRGTY